MLTYSTLDKLITKCSPLNRKVSLASRTANLEDSPISAYVAGGAFNRPIRRGLSVGGEFADRPPLILLIFLFQL